MASKRRMVVRKIIVSGFLLAFLILSMFTIRNLFWKVSAAPPENPPPPQASGTTISYGFDSDHLLRF